MRGLLKDSGKDFNSKIATSQAESKENFKEGRQLDRLVTGKEVKNIEVISNEEFHGSSKRSKTDCESECVCLGRMTLQVKDKYIIIQGEKLADKHMTASQSF